VSPWGAGCRPQEAPHSHLRNRRSGLEVEVFAEVFGFSRNHLRPLASGTPVALVVHMPTFNIRSLVVLALSLPLAIACAGTQTGDDVADGSDPEGETAGLEADASELSSSVSCSSESMAAYQGGSKIGNVEVVKIGGKRVAVKTAHAFLKLQKAAAAAGVDIGINSGFRTMDEQKYFYGCYQSGNCNSGNLAARPGYSNHQNGRALDLSNSRSSWLINNAARFGFKRTVPSETWHYEFFGSDPGGPCGGGGGGSTDNTPDDNSTECKSATLGRMVSEDTCVEARSDSNWYKCSGGVWKSTTSSDSTCSKKFPLN
jgi:D-alanyl-D-alanine carboxypeptidase